MIQQNNLALNLPVIDRQLISADRRDMPEEIKAIRVPTFNQAAMVDALSLMRGRVHTVQIEVDDMPKELIGLPHLLRTHYGSFEFEIQVMDPQTCRRTVPFDIKAGIDRFFRTDKRIGAPAVSAEHKSLVEEWGRQLAKMPMAAHQALRDTYMGMWIYGQGRVDHKEADSLPHFHTHAAFKDPFTQKTFPGYFVSHVPNHDGTVFRIREDQFWYAKANSIVMHVTEGHFRVESPEHDAPDKFLSPIENELRGTAILQAYPTVLTMDR